MVFMIVIYDFIILVILHLKIVEKAVFVVIMASNISIYWTKWCHCECRAGKWLSSKRLIQTVGGSHSSITCHLLSNVS